MKCADAGMCVGKAAGESIVTLAKASARALQKHGGNGVRHAPVW